MKKKKDKNQATNLLDLAKVVPNVVLGVIGYLTISLPPKLAGLSKGCAAVGIMLSVLWAVRYSRKAENSNPLVLRWPMLSLIFAFIGYSAVRFLPAYFDYHTPSGPYAILADLLIAFLYAITFSLLALSCFVLIVRAGKDADGLVK